MTLAEPSFPPLLTGEACAPGQAFVKAQSAAALGTDAGLVVWADRADALEAAVVLAPEHPLGRAIGVVFAFANAMGDAIGALGPPEVAVHCVWPGGLKLNGADFGRLTAAASTHAPEAVPDWLVVGAEVRYLPDGSGPESTCLAEEGCEDVTPPRLLESWARHSLVWINTFEDEGLQPLHTAWCGRAWEMGEPLPDGSGIFTGLDERGGMLIRTPVTTRLRPLTEMLA